VNNSIFLHRISCKLTKILFFFKNYMLPSITSFLDLERHDPASQKKRKSGEIEERKDGLEEDSRTIRSAVL